MWDGTVASATVPGSGSSTVSVTSLAAGGLSSQTVSFGVTLPSVPRAVVAYVSGFVSGSALSVIKGTQSVTTTDFTVTIVNTGSGAATFTNLPVKYLYWL